MPDGAQGCQHREWSVKTRPRLGRLEARQTRVCDRPSRVKRRVAVLGTCGDPFSLRCRLWNSKQGWGVLQSEAGQTHQSGLERLVHRWPVSPRRGGPGSEGLWHAGSLGTVWL